MNAGDYQGNAREWMKSASGMKGNAGEGQGNEEWRQSSRGTQGNAGGHRGIQGNASGTYGSGCKVPGECWKMQGNAR